MAMNQTEKRRKELLENAQTAYRDRGVIPAVHPRYRASYTSLYNDDEEALFLSGTLGLRLFICALLFALFVAIDYKEASILNVDSKRITEEIGCDLNIQEVWKQL